MKCCSVITKIDRNLAYQTSDGLPYRIPASYVTFSPKLGCRNDFHEFSLEYKLLIQQEPLGVCSKYSLVQNSYVGSTSLFLIFQFRNRDWEAKILALWFSFHRDGNYNMNILSHLVVLQQFCHAYMTF